MIELCTKISQAKVSIINRTEVQGRKGFENLPKNFHKQVSYVLRFWQTSINFPQVFVTRINIFKLLQTYS